MSFSSDLLDQAGYLAALDIRRPRQVNLRRAGSSAYYSLFHKLSGEASERLSPSTPQLLRKQFARAFNHADMKKVCGQIANGNPSLAAPSAGLSTRSAELRSVARTFVDMQEARHRADYDLTQDFSRSQVLALLSQTKDASMAGTRMRVSDEANVFLAALLLGDRWSK